MSVEALELGALFSMAGMDLDFAKRKGGPLSLAVRGWIISLALRLGGASLVVRQNLSRDRKQGGSW
jgi:hypothetical protein